MCRRIDRERSGEIVSSVTGKGSALRRLRMVSARLFDSALHLSPSYTIWPLAGG